MQHGRSAPQNWLIYALGGGLGHLTRSIALARVATRKAVAATVSVLTNSPFAAALPEMPDTGCRIIRLSHELRRDDVIRQVQNLLRQQRPGLLVVDTFPRGLAGELPDVLPDLACAKVLTHRDLSPDYCRAFPVAEAANQFDLILLPGESAPLAEHPRAILTAPWLIRDASELLHRQDARSKMNVGTTDEKIIAVVGSGTPDEVVDLRQLSLTLARQYAGSVQVRFFSLHSEAVVPESSGNQPQNWRQQRFWPFFELIRGIDLVVGGGGYNTVHECRATATPLLGVARKRLYDRQLQRLSTDAIVADNDAIAAKAKELLRAEAPISGNHISFTNGVHQAVELIGNLPSAQPK